MSVALRGRIAGVVWTRLTSLRRRCIVPPGSHVDHSALVLCVPPQMHRVPPTVHRNGPFGPGMVQLWVDTKDGDDLVDVLAPRDVPAGWRRVLKARDRFGDPAVLTHADHSDVRLLAALDVIINNADRKGGHVLHGTDGRVYGVDH